LAHIREVFVEARSLKRFEEILPLQAVSDAEAQARAVARRLAGHAVWNINSTATGGGVAEMLASLLGYPREYGIDARWAVIEGTPEFFNVTKRLHHAIQGSAGDGSPLEETQRVIYEAVSAENADELRRLVRRGDIVILHDPQTAGLAPHLLRHGCPVIWRCHIGDDRTSEESSRGWRFPTRSSASDVVRTRRTGSDHSLYRAAFSNGRTGRVTRAGEHALDPMIAVATMRQLLRPTQPPTHGSVLVVATCGRRCAFIGISARSVVSKGQPRLEVPVSARRLTTFARARTFATRSTPFHHPSPCVVFISQLPSFARPRSWPDRPEKAALRPLR